MDIREADAAAQKQSNMDLAECIRISKSMSIEDIMAKGLIIQKAREALHRRVDVSALDDQIILKIDDSYGN